MTQLERPLHGDYLYTLKISTTSGKRELAKRRNAMELALTEIVSSVRHVDHQGIFVINLFEAEGEGSGGLAALEAAMRHNPKSQRFLVTGVASRLMVATSRIGYPFSGSYDVVPSRRVGDYEFDMFDLSSATSDGVLLRQHVSRVQEHGGDVDTVASFDVEGVFRNVALFAPERH